MQSKALPMQDPFIPSVKMKSYFCSLWRLFTCMQSLHKHDSSIQLRHHRDFGCISGTKNLVPAYRLYLFCRYLVMKLILLEPHQASNACSSFRSKHDFSMSRFIWFSPSLSKSQHRKASSIYSCRTNKSDHLNEFFPSIMQECSAW